MFSGMIGEQRRKDSGTIRWCGGTDRFAICNKRRPSRMRRKRDDETRILREDEVRYDTRILREGSPIRHEDTSRRKSDTIKRKKGDGSRTHAGFERSEKG